MQSSEFSNESYKNQESSLFEVSWSHILQEEITLVVTTLRRNRRWSIGSSYYQKPSSKHESWNIESETKSFDYCQVKAQKSPFGFETLLEFHASMGKSHRYPYMEDPLFQGFSQLRARLSTVQDLKDLDPLLILNPFLQVIKYGDTTGQIIGSALASIQRLFSLKIIDPNSPHLNRTMAEVVNSVTRCKFEASDSASDEAVLSKILKLLTVIVKSEAGKKWLDDRGVCEMVEVAFGMYFQGRISDFLRNAAHECLESILQVVFSRLSEIVKTLKSKKTKLPDLKIVKEQQEDTESVVSSLETNPGDDLDSKENDYFKPFGLASIVELLRVLSTLADPTNRQHTDSLHRMIALNLLHTAFEVGGHSLCEFITWAQSKDKIKKPLGFSRKSSLVDMEMYLQGTGDQPNGTMSVMDSMNPTLESQETQMNGSQSGKSSSVFTNFTNNDERFTLKEQVRLGLIAHELVTNDICKHLFSILQTYDLVFNNPPSWQVTLLVRSALQVIVSIFQTQRCFLKYQMEYFIEWCIQMVDSGIVSWDIEDWMIPLETKRNSVHSQQSERTKPKEILVGEVRELILLALYHLCESIPLFPEFYMNYDGDMTVRTNLFEELMRFLSRNSFPDVTFGGPVTTVAHQTLCLDILLGFVSDLHSQRHFMSGECPKASVLKENISKKRNLIQGSLLFNEDPKAGIQYLQVESSESDIPIASQSAAYVLSYSVIMLHTDQHNPQVRKRMTFEDFARNNRGVNDGKDFDAAFLREIYDAIKEKEILLPEEHGGHVGFAYKWKEILHLAEEQKGVLLMSKREPIVEYNADMFVSIWGPLLASLLYVFDSTEDRLVFDKVTLGIYQCGTLASHYGYSVILDYILMSLSKLSGLVTVEPTSSTESLSSSYPLDAVSPMTQSILDFSCSIKSQVAALLMFHLVQEYTETVSESWSFIAKSLCTLFKWGFLTRYQSLPDLKNEPLAIKPLERSPQEVPSNTLKKESGLLSTLTQLLNFSSDESEHDALNSSIDKGNQIAQFCNIDNLLAMKDKSSVIGLFRALVSLSFKMDKKHPMEDKKPLDSSLPFILVVLNQLIQRNEEHFESLWTLYQDLLLTVIGMEKENALLLELICILLFQLLDAYSQTPEDSSRNSRIQQIYTLILAFPKETFPLYAEQYCLGISLLCSNKDLKGFESSQWEKAIGFLSASSMIPKVVALGLQASMDLIDKELTCENYGECVDLLLNFPASCASLVASGMVAFPSHSKRLSTSTKDPLYSCIFLKFLTLFRTTVIQVSIQALDKIYAMHSCIHEWKESIPSHKVFYELWLPILSGIGQHCYHPLREIRQHSFSLLQKSLLSSELQDPIMQCMQPDIFDTVLFPLLDELIKSDVFLLDPIGMDETRMRASALLCKTFLHFLPNMSPTCLASLWSRILRYLERYMSLGKNDYLHEGVLESLKNMLLVLSTQGYLVHHAKSTKEDVKNLWEITWETLDYSSFSDLFPSSLVESNVSEKTMIQESLLKEEKVDGIS